MKTIVVYKPRFGKEEVEVEFDHKFFAEWYVEDITKNKLFIEWAYLKYSLNQEENK